VSVMSWRSEGRVFQAAGPLLEKPRSPNLAERLSAEPVDLSRYLPLSAETVKEGLTRYKNPPNGSVNISDVLLCLGLRA